MTKKENNTKEKNVHGKPERKKVPVEYERPKPWISMRSALWVIAAASLMMGVLTAWQAVPAKGWVEGILLGVVFGGAIWVIFLGNVLINRFLRGK